MKTAYKKYAALLFFVLAVEMLSAQVLSLDSMLTIAERRNPQLKLYEARAGAASAYATGARALDPPQIGAGFFMTPYNTAMWKGDDMTGAQGMGSFMLSAQQMFMNGAKRDANAAYMQGMADVDREMGKAMRNEIFSMVKMNYFEWQIMKKKLALLSESEKLLAYIIQSAEINYTYGMEKLNAYYKSKAMLGDVQNMRLMIEFEISQKKIALNTLMNRDPGSVIEVDTLVALKDYDLEPADTSRLSAGRSDLRSIDRSIQVMRARQGLERSKLRPDFGLKYDHMIAFGRQPQQFSLMGMMTIPIAPWSSKMSRSSVEGLGLEIESLHYERQAILVNAGGALQSYREQIRVRKQQLELYEKNILPDMLRNYQTSLIAYEQNNEELFMTLDAWQNLNLVRLAYLDLLNGLLQLQVNYEKESEIR